MAKIVIGHLGGHRARTKAKDTSVKSKQVRTVGSGAKVLRTIETSSSTFETDLRYVFERNVSKARRDNKQAIGATDLVVAKT